MVVRVVESGLEFSTRIGEALAGDVPELAHIDMPISQKGGIRDVVRDCTGDIAGGTYGSSGYIGAKLCR